jgi:stage II sporulation protein D
MLRAEFAGSLATTLLATGGLDIWSTPSPQPGSRPIRVLIGDTRAGDRPQPLDATTFAFGGVRWRGIPSITPLPGGRDGVIATVDLEAYLQGVVPIEASPGWPPAALQAQAIVARTYAQSKRTLSRPYDLVNSESDQRWAGIAAEYPSTSAAVAATRGRILTFAGGPASVFYASCCGGHTADAAEIWGHTALPYLRGVPDPYCVPAPDYRWQHRVPLEQIGTALGARSLGEILSFTLDDIGDDGRPLRVEIDGSSGRSSLKTSDFRRMVGYDTIRSTWIRQIGIDSTQAMKEALIEGSGRGHGVGMCQWGARYMSAAGFDARAILAMYFPGTVVSDA